MPADRAATGRNTGTDTSANTDTAVKADTSAGADTSAKADAPTKADAVMRTESAVPVEAAARADAAARGQAADRSDSRRREDGLARSDAAGQGGESASAGQDTESDGPSAAGASVPDQEPTGTEPEAGQVPDAKPRGAGSEAGRAPDVKSTNAEPEAGQKPDAKPHGTEPEAGQAPDAKPTGAEPSGAEPRPAHADDGDAGGSPAEDIEPGVDAAHEGEPTARDAVSAPGPDGRPRRTTRRFPLFTRDTARPEGGGRAAPRDAPAPARQWPILAVIGTVGLGLLLTALDVFRFGTLLIGVALLAGGVMRWTLPDVGMLAVRSRFTDLVTYGVLGVTIVLLAMMAQPSPWLEIPFLDDTLHFTIRT